MAPTREGRPLPAVWLRAAVLGSIWAAVEIVLGSFLHNVRFPLTGEALSAIGVCLCVSGSRLWPDRGLIWRAGLVCALLKSLSPSAVIFGPMVAIAAEGFLLEGGVRLLGRNAAGWLVGGALATLEPLAHKAVGLLVTYGPDAGRLYVALCAFAARVLRVEALGPVNLLAALAVLSALAGVLAAWFGMAVGRSAAAAPAAVVPAGTPAGARDPFAAPAQRYAPLLLVVHAGALAGGVLALARLPLPAAAGAVLGYVGLALARYPRLRARLARPRLWVEIVAVSLLAGVVLGRLSGRGGGAGLATGCGMALRAMLVVTAFAAVGIELRNPAVLRRCLGGPLGRLPEALGVAFEALPVMTALLGDQRRLLRRPVPVLGEVLAGGAAWLARIADGAPRPAAAVVVLTGDSGAGKTTLLLGLAGALRATGLTVGGIAAPVVRSDGARVGYDLLALDSGVTAPLCRTEGGAAAPAVGPFRFRAEGLALGRAALAAADRCDVVLVDEIGPLELRGEGWAPALPPLWERAGAVVVLAVRPGLVEAVAARWELRPRLVWRAGAVTPDAAAAALRALRAEGTA
ncbi:MAG: nucleoside-triphosphatase [Candidatus Krumholzibacteriia bacterium]